MSPFSLLLFVQLVATVGLPAALLEYVLFTLLPIPRSPQALLMSQPGLGLTAFSPRRLLAPVLMLNHYLEWSVFIPSLPDWDQ